MIINSEFNKKQIPEETKIETINKLITASRYLSIIIYCNRKLTAQHLHKQLQFTSAVITSEQSVADREDKFSRFRQHKIRALITVNCISEGVDLPEADACIFYDDRKSIINIIQCVGRIMRKSPAKCSSTLIYPVYADDDINYLCYNILTTINGELGYGSVDLRRILHIKYINIIEPEKIQRIHNHVSQVLFEYNKDLFKAIDMNDKLEWCKNRAKISGRKIPGIDYILKTSDDETSQMVDFIKDHVYNDNKAGREIRRIFGRVLVGFNKLKFVPELNANTTDEEYEKIITRVWNETNHQDL